MLSFASATGNLYNRLGKLGALIENLNSYQATQQTAMIDTVSGVVAQYDAESDIQALMGSSYIGILNSFGSVGSTAQQIAVATVNRMIEIMSSTLYNNRRHGSRYLPCLHTTTLSRSNGHVQQFYAKNTEPKSAEAQGRLQRILERRSWLAGIL